MPRASRRRRRAPGRGLGQSALVGIAATITLVLVGGSLLAIHTQSQGYRSATSSGYVALADQVALASTRTGARLSALMAGAPALANQDLPHTARGTLQQGLDAAVLDTASQVAQARTIASPPPVSDFATRFTRVMQLRASATAQLRTTVDDLLGMQPLPVAGAPTSPAAAAPATLISSNQAAGEMSAEGQVFEQADTDYRSLRAVVATQSPPLRLQASVWVPPPVATAPLGSVSLGATAPALASSAALVPLHHLVVTAVGLSPPAVPSGGTGMSSTSCADPVSTVSGAVPAVLPPTATVSSLVSVTNCGNVSESNVMVTATLAPSDPPGTAAAPSGGAGGRSQAVVAIASGSSSAPSLAPLPVASGHRYVLTVTVSLPPGQADPRGSSQQFLLQVAG